MGKGTVSILGCGWYGFALAKALIADGYTIKGSTTTEGKLAQLKEAGIQPYLLNLADKKTVLENDFFNCTTLIICISPRKKNEDDFNFVEQINNIAIIALNSSIKNLLLISSTGIYEDGNFIVNENTNPKPTSENGKLLLAAETLLRNNLAFSTTIIRFGGLIGPNRNLAKHFAGKKDIPNGLAPINLIHLRDCIGVTRSILAQEAFGNLFHAVAPNHPTRAAFYTKACEESGFEKPEFIDELLAWKQIESINLPTIINYQWEVNFML